MKRRIPLAALSTTAMASACTPSIVGDWELTDVEGYLEQYLEDYDGTLEGELRIDRDLEAELDLELCYDDDGERYCGAYSYEDGEVDDEGDGEYRISFEDDLRLGCELDDGVLECDFGEGGVLEFEKG